MSPLDGIRVIELGHALAGPLAATFLGDFGADVIKVERPDGGDSLRESGPKYEGAGIWFSVTGRNKRSVCLDMKAKAGKRILYDLVDQADVVVENFRPGVLDRAGFGWTDLSRRNSRLVMLRVSGYGQEGPYRERPGFGKIAEAFSGATYLTGEADQAPLHPGYSLGDATTGLMGAFGVALALFHRESSGRGQLVDLALYEPLFRMIEWQVPLHQLRGEVIERAGTQFPFAKAFITGVCTASDGGHVVSSAATTATVRRLQEFLVDVGELDAPVEDYTKVDEALRRWVATQPRDVALRELSGRGLVSGAVLSGADIAADPHIAARGNIITASDGRGVNIPMPAVLPTLSESPGSVRHAGPMLGEHTRQVLVDELGLSVAEYETLRTEGVVYADPELSGQAPSVAKAPQFGLAVGD